MWVPSEDPRSAGAFVGMAEVAEAGTPWLLQRIARGSGEFILLGESSLICDDALVQRLFRAALREAGAGVQWAALVESLPEPVVAATSFGAFGDRDAALRFHGRPARVRALREFLASDLAPSD